ncbi:MAG: MmgE/PrpD family protein [Phycisphaerales bacterium]|nr:MmgE/PrpD family protein [Phycisphaerales bacterium]
MTTATASSMTLPRNENQALGIGTYACEFMRTGDPSSAVKHRTIQFFTDSVLCGLSALALQTNAPVVLRDEALTYPSDGGATVFGSSQRVAPEKAIAANASAVREWDSNGTNFGYNPTLGHTAGEFGHNDFYAVPIAAAQVAGLDGAAALRGMICLDEIRGRLAEVFSLKSYKIDHVVHGAIASAAVYGAMLGATPEQIESAIGMVVAHYIPWRAIRAGKQLSDSKGASAAISTEVAILSMKRSMKGFIGPRDIFRNPEAIWRQFEPTDGDSPFDLVLSTGGDDFAVMGMHFKLGLYEHQSAGALQGIIDLVSANPTVLENPDTIKQITIVAYEPAFGIIGDPAKRDPKTRQSADHSMVYIVSTMLRKAIERAAETGSGTLAEGNDAWWKLLMLAPADYGRDAIADKTTRGLMDKIQFEHGGQEYDDRYPDGIPTSLVIELTDGTKLDSGLVMYPSGHARNTSADLDDILLHKAGLLGEIAMEDASSIIERCNGIEGAADLGNLWEVSILQRDPVD